jgi:ketosteroid isomerase-like protein
VSSAPVLELFDAFRRGDAEAMLRLVDRDVEISDPERVGKGPFVGHDEFLKFIGDWMETWEQYEVLLEARVVVGETVVAFVRHLGRAAGSGVQVDQPGAHFCRVQDGLVVFWRPYSDRTEALGAAGLQQPDMWRTAIDTLQEGYEAWSRRDYDALLGLLPKEFEFVPVVQAPDMPAFSGREGIEEFWESLLSTWKSFVFFPQSYEPLGDQVLVEVRVRAKARASGIELEERWAHLYTLRDGEFVRMQAFLDPDEARAALLS